MAAASESSFWDFKGIDEYNDRKLLISSPYPILLVVTSYLYFVLKWGPNYMKSREPYNLRNWLVGYNALQVIVTFVTFVVGSSMLWKQGLWPTTCHVDRDMEKRLRLVDGSHYYFLTKVVELVDTVFFVLRKKQRQVSFLHVYHHTIMVMATWLITKYARNDTVLFLGVINSLVHVIMYAYYGLSAFPHLAKYLWWKKYITMMQL
ncbi:very long chain fatty acid elongase 4-like isoform X2 [Anticarsia gemmatalis]